MFTNEVIPEQNIIGAEIKEKTTSVRTEDEQTR